MYSATSQGTVQFGHDFGLIRSMVHTSALCSKMVTFLMFMATLWIVAIAEFSTGHICISTELTHPPNTILSSDQHKQKWYKNVMPA